MKNSTFYKKASVSIIAAFGLAHFAWAADTQFSATLTIDSPVEVTRNQNLQFGTIVKPSANRALTVAADDNGAAQFSVTGNDNSNIVVSVSPATVQMYLGGNENGPSIEVGSFSYGGDLDGDGKGTLSANGVLDDVRVGATAAVSAGQASGQYDGTITLRTVYE